MKPSIILFLFIFFLPKCFSQKQVTSVQQIWLGNTSQLRFSNHWGFAFDLQVRSRENFFQGISQVSSRIGAVYYLNESVRIGAGYYFADNIPRDYRKAVFQDEHTGWQQISWSNKMPRLNINQSFRLEERFRHRIINETKLGKGYNFNYRTRYNILFNIGLARKPFTPHTLAAVFYNEVYLNFGKQIVYNTFDQLRAFGGFNYTITKNANLKFGYLYSFQQLAVGNRYRNLHAVRIFYLYNLDLRKKKTTNTKAMHDVSYSGNKLNRLNNARFLAVNHHFNAKYI